MREKEKTRPGPNREQPVRERPQKREKARESVRTADHRKRTAQGSPEEPGEPPAAAPTDRANIRGGTGLIEGIEERTHQQAAQLQPAPQAMPAGGDGRQAEAQAGASPSSERSGPPGFPPARSRAGRTADRKERNGAGNGGEANHGQHTGQAARAQRPVAARSAARLAGEKRAGRPAGGGGGRDENPQGGPGQREGRAKQGEILAGVREAASRVWRRAASGLL